MCPTVANLMRLSPQDALALGNWQGVPKDTGVDTHHARQVAMPTLYAGCKEAVSVAIKMEVAWAVRKAAKAASAGPATGGACGLPAGPCGGDCQGGCLPEDVPRRAGGPGRGELRQAAGRAEPGADAGSGVVKLELVECGEQVFLGHVLPHQQRLGE